MMEELRSIRVSVVVDTNKRTVETTEVVHSPAEAVAVVEEILNDLRYDPEIRGQ